MLDLNQYHHYPLQGFLVFHEVDCCKPPKHMLGCRQPHRRFGFVTKHLLGLLPHHAYILHSLPRSGHFARRIVPTGPAIPAGALKAHHQHSP